MSRKSGPPGRVKRPPSGPSTKEADPLSETNDVGPSDEDRRTMREVMDHLHARAHFRYPVDGVGSEFDQIFEEALDDMFGPDSPNSPQKRWERKLRWLGLIR